MGIFDNVTSAVNRGTASAGRAAEKVKLNSRISELTKKRQSLAAQLGASLYDATKTDPVLRAGREQLYDGIALCDTEREECQRQIAQLDAQSKEANTASSTFKCVVCGATMSGSDLFCSGCGSPAEKARPAAMPMPPTGGSHVCSACGSPMAADDLFCMNCGAPAGAKQEEAPLANESTLQKACDSCGASVGADDLFCMSCGAPVNAKSDAPASDQGNEDGKTCVSCGGALEEGDLFCMSCGTKVDEVIVAEFEVISDQDDASSSLPMPDEAVEEDPSGASSHEGNSAETFKED